jgi:ribosome-binding factor A
MSRHNRSNRARDARAGDVHSQDFRRTRAERPFLEEMNRLLRESSDPTLATILIVAIELSADGGHASVPYAVRADPFADEAALKRGSRAALERASGYLRTSLASQFGGRRAPTLGFCFIGATTAEAAEFEMEGEECPE